MPEHEIMRLHAGGPALRAGPAHADGRRLWNARIEVLASRGLPMDTLLLLLEVVIRWFGPVRMDEPQAWVDLTDNNGGVFMAVEVVELFMAVDEHDSDVEV